MALLSRRALLTAVAASVAASAPAAAQPGAEPGALAQIKDPRQLTEALSAITQDPAIPVDDPQTRTLAQALMVEGVKQLNARAFDQALANFLEAYGRFPSPKILLNIAATLREMGRLADAANTYQRYLLDPATGPERVAEVKQLLLDLDAQLTILTVRVTPRGSEVSLDAGPFIPVGSSLQTRVRPGIHLLRVRKGDATGEVTLNGFEAENKEVVAAVPEGAAATATTTTTTGTTTTGTTTTGTTTTGTTTTGTTTAGTTTTGTSAATTATTAKPAAPPKPPAEHVEGWLITGTQYAAEDATGAARRPRAGFGGAEIRPYVPSFDISDDGEVTPREPEGRIHSGVVGVVRIDGEGRGFAGGLGLAVAGQHLEAEMMVLRSNSTGAYLGVRYRLFTGWLRPYVAAGVPAFIYDERDALGATSTKLGIGVRAAAGIELRINGHLSVKGDIGYEHFFVDEMSRFDANIFVPTVGVVGRL